MTPERHHADLAELRTSLRRQQALSLTLGVAVLLMVFAVLGKRTTVILEPPSRAKTVAITGDRVDAAWLEEMGTYIAHLMLDATPRSIDWCARMGRRCRWYFWVRAMIRAHSGSNHF